MEADLTVAEAAAILRMPRQSLQRLAKRGGIPHRKDGRAYKFTPAHIEAYRQMTEVVPALNMGRSSRSRGGRTA